jgi:hypothetical protein
MLVSLDKNKWLYEWIQDKWQDDIYNILIAMEPDVPRPNELRAKIAQLLQSKGYKAKVTSKFDVLIAMKDEDFIILKLRYE